MAVIDTTSPTTNSGCYEGRPTILFGRTIQHKDHGKTADKTVTVIDLNSRLDSRFLE